MAGGIISEWWASSFRNDGRLRPESADYRRRHLHSLSNQRHQCRYAVLTHVAHNADQWRSSDRLAGRMRIKRLPAGFIIPAQPVMASKPPFGTDWGHEIKHDGYRLIVRRNGSTVRLYTRNAYDWTARLQTIAAAGSG
jgi:hypothetical protein